VDLLNWVWQIGGTKSPITSLLSSDGISPNSHSRFNGHFPGGRVLVGTRMSPFWILLELRVVEVVVTTGTVKRAKLQSKCHHQQTNTQKVQE